MNKPRTELEIRRAANILEQHWGNAVKRGHAHAAAAVGCALSALMWAVGDDGELASGFGELVDGTREDLRQYTRRN